MIKNKVKKLKKQLTFNKSRLSKNISVYKPLYILRKKYFNNGNLPKAKFFYYLWLGKRLKKSGITGSLNKSSESKLLFKNNSAPAKISIFMGSRFKDNSNFKLNDFLKSLVETLHNSSNLEILIAVDLDDDLDGIKKIINDFKELNMKLVGTERGRGYFDLHIKYHLMIPYISERSELIIICSDDCFFNKKDWDAITLEKISMYKELSMQLHK